MFVITNKSLFDTEALVIVNPVNTFGVMGAGLAKAIKAKHPRIMTNYKRKCYYNTLKVKDKNKAKQYISTSGVIPLKVGRPYMESVGENNSRRYRYVVMFPTKHDWKQKSEYRYIRDGLRHIGKHWKEMVITSIAFPLLGAGLGGLDKKKVLKLIIDEMRDSGIPKVVIHVDDDLVTWAEKQI